MKKTQKNILGLAGLGLVLGITAVAIAIPSSDASALTELVNTVSVRVVETSPNVDAQGIESGSSFVKSKQTITVGYENVVKVAAKIIYTDLSGATHEIDLGEVSVSEQSGELPYDFDFSDPQYGYGSYQFVVTGTNSLGVTDEDIIEFTYHAFDAEKIEVKEETSDKERTYVDLDYTPDDGTGDGKNKVTEFIIHVFDPYGNEVVGLSPITLPAPGTRVEIPFNNYDLKPGIYTILVSAYNRTGDLLETKEFKKEIKKPDTPEDVPVPDTGGLFNNLNVSESDLLVTGLIVFFIAGICGIVFISRKSTQ